MFVIILSEFYLTLKKVKFFYEKKKKDKPRFFQELSNIEIRFWMHINPCSLPFDEI